MSTAIFTSKSTSPSVPSSSPPKQFKDSEKKEQGETVNPSSNPNSNSKKGTNPNFQGKKPRTNRPGQLHRKTSSASTQTVAKVLTPKSPYFLYSYLDPSASSQCDESEVQTGTDPQTTNYC
ncbi:2894_t:CDS:1, partial [Ambispora leptoticha]